MKIHPARVLSFDALYTKLEEAYTQGLVYRHKSGGHLLGYCYSDKCVYEKLWNDVTLMARGIILDINKKEVVATPFPKFFNIGEKIDSIPNLPFQTYEKLDGSLIIIFFYNNQWQCATKGSFNSDQAIWAQTWLDEQELFYLEEGTTYLAEAIYTQNKIVIKYPYEGLVLLGAYDKAGYELSYEKLLEMGKWLNWKVAQIYNYESISELLALTKTLPSTQEGFVLHFSDGSRLKVKGDEYCRIHKMVSHVTPLAIWETMFYNTSNDLENTRKELPEEFWEDFDSIIYCINHEYNNLANQIVEITDPLKDLSNKEVGLLLHTLPANLRGFIFAYRKEGQFTTGMLRTKIFRTIRPTGNILKGYTPSNSMNRIMVME